MNDKKEKRKKKKHRQEDVRLKTETPNQVDQNNRIKSEERSSSNAVIDTKELEDGRIRLIIDLPNELYTVKIKRLRNPKERHSSLQLMKEERLTVKSEGDDCTVIKVEKLSVAPDTEVEFIKSENRYNPSEIYEISEEEEDCSKVKGSEKLSDSHNKSAKRVGLSPRKHCLPSTGSSAPSTKESVIARERSLLSLEKHLARESDFKISNVQTNSPSTSRKHKCPQTDTNQKSLGINQVSLGPSFRLLERHVSNEQTSIENRLKEASTSKPFITHRTGKSNAKNTPSSNRSPPVRLRKASPENVSYKRAATDFSSDDSDTPQSGWESSKLSSNKNKIQGNSNSSVKEFISKHSHKRSSASESDKETTKKVYAAKYVETNRPVPAGITQHKPVIKRYKPRLNLVYKAVSDTDTDYSSSSDEDTAKQKKTPNQTNMHKAGSSYSSSHSHTRKPIETTFQYDHSESLPDVVPHEEGTQTRKKTNPVSPNKQVAYPTHWKRHGAWNDSGSKGPAGPSGKKIKVDQANGHHFDEKLFVLDRKGRKCDF